MADSWETVVNKKKSHVTKSDVKKAQLKFIEDEKIPKMEQLDPIPLSTNSYANQRKLAMETDGDSEKYPSMVAFDPEKTRQDDKLKQGSPRSQVRKREKKPVKPPTPTFDVKGAIQSLKPTVLSGIITDVTSKFAGNPMIWLKEVASWMQIELAGPADKDLSHLNQTQDFPSCFLQGEIRSLLINLLKDCPSNVVGDFFLGMTASMVSQIQLGHGTLSERILVQLITRTHDEVIPLKCEEVVRGKSKNSDSYLAIIWSLSQYTSDFATGFTIWWSTMFSSLKSKTFAPACIKYLEKMTRIHKNSLRFITCIKQDQFMEVIELINNPQSPLSHSPSLLQDLSDLQPLLTQLMLNEETASECFQYFMNVISKPDLPSQMKEQLCLTLVECLATSSDVMQWWIENFLATLRANSILLKHIDNNFQGFNARITNSGKYSYRNVWGHASYCMLQNMEKANAKGKQDKKQGFKECRSLCLSFIRQHERVQASKWGVGSILRVVLSLLLLALAADVYSKGGYSNSHTNKFLEKHGLDKHVDMVIHHAHQGATTVFNFCEKNAPVAYEKLEKHVFPALNTAWEYSVFALAALCNHCKPVIEKTNEVLPPLLEQATDMLAEYSTLAFSYFVKAWNTYSPMCLDLLTQAYNWLSINLPKAYLYAKELVLLIIDRIYNLHPELFDQLAVASKNALSYVVQQAPIVADQSYTLFQQGYSRAVALFQ